MRRCWTSGRLVFAFWRLIRLWPFPTYGGVSGRLSDAARTRRLSLDSRSVTSDVIFGVINAVTAPTGGRSRSWQITRRRTTACCRWFSRIRLISSTGWAACRRSGGRRPVIHWSGGVRCAPGWRRRIERRPLRIGSLGRHLRQRSQRPGCRRLLLLGAARRFRLAFWRCGQRLRLNALARA